jgi:hypothetical protein
MRACERSPGLAFSLITEPVGDDKRHAQLSRSGPGGTAQDVSGGEELAVRGPDLVAFEVAAVVEGGKLDGEQEPRVPLFPGGFRVCAGAGGEREVHAGQGCGRGFGDRLRFPSRGLPPGGLPRGPQVARRDGGSARGRSRNRWPARVWRAGSGSAVRG